MSALRICFVGDSITNGTHDDAYLGWPGRLCAREGERGHDLTCYNLGIRADTSDMIRRRWRVECAARLPEKYPGAVVLAFGVNDAADEEGLGIRVPPERSLENARAMVTEACAWRPTLWIGPAPTDDRRQPFRPGPQTSYAFDNGRNAETNAAYKRLAGELGVPYLDVFTPLAADPRWPDYFEGVDGVHPVGAGYAVLADLVGAWSAWRELIDV